MRVNELTETVRIPADIAAALATGRPEMLNLVQNRAVDAAMFGDLVNTIRVLMETNRKLQDRLNETVRLLDGMDGSLKGTRTHLLKVLDFATGQVRAEDEDNA